MSKKIMVLGSNGMAGHVIAIGLQEDYVNYEVVTVARNSGILKPDIILDVTNFLALKDIIYNIKPDVVVNCIGILNKSAESSPDLAVLINSYLPHFLENITNNTDIKIIHISTDCVFSGDKGHYEENSLKDGRGFYAQSKAIGEIENKKDLTFRTSIIGPEINNNGIGLFHWVSSQKGNVNGFTNAFWTGVTSIELLAAVKSAIDENLIGVYHLVNENKISKYSLLKLIVDEFKFDINIVPFDDFKVDKSLLNTRTDFNFRVNSYKNMIANMKKWILDHQVIYSYNLNN